MICNSQKELLAEIKKYMDIQDIPMKDLALRLNKSQQSISQIFNNGNPKCSTLFEICNALNLQIDIHLNQKSDASN